VREVDLVAARCLTQGAVGRKVLQTSCRLARNVSVRPYCVLYCAEQNKLCFSPNDFINPLHPSALPLTTLWRIGYFLHIVNQIISNLHRTQTNTLTGIWNREHIIRSDAAALWDATQCRLVISLLTLWWTIVCQSSEHNSTVEMKAAVFLETSVLSYQTARRHITQYVNFHEPCQENCHILRSVRILYMCTNIRLRKRGQYHRQSIFQLQYLFIYLFASLNSFEMSSGNYWKQTSSTQAHLISTFWYDIYNFKTLPLPKHPCYLESADMPLNISCWFQFRWDIYSPTTCMSLKQRFPHELHQIKLHVVLCYYTIWPAFYLSHEIQYPRFSRQNIILDEQALLIF
jgi:hypothetical protein